MSFSIIAVVGKNRELGRKNQLIWRLPKDLQFFKKTTMHHPILMGHKTFDSLPGLLPGRKHYVVTRQKSLNFDDKKIVQKNNTTNTDKSDQVEIVNNLPEFIKQHENSAEEIFVIGGGMIYQEMLLYCKKLYLTEVGATAPDADTFFPEFDKSQYGRHVIGTENENDIKYQFVEYTKNKEI